MQRFSEQIVFGARAEHSSKGAQYDPIPKIILRRSNASFFSKWLMSIVNPYLFSGHTSHFVHRNQHMRDICIVVGILPGQDNRLRQTENIDFVLYMMLQFQRQLYFGIKLDILVIFGGRL